MKHHSDEELQAIVQPLNSKGSNMLSGRAGTVSQGDGMGSQNVFSVDDNQALTAGTGQGLGSYDNIPRVGRKYKRRWLMLLILVVLNLASGMVWGWSLLLLRRK